MRLILIFLLLICAGSGYSQDFIIYKDSLYHFQVGIPVGWRYGKPKSYPRLLLMSIRPAVDSTDQLVETFNVTCVNEPNSSLDSTFNHFIEYNSAEGDFKLIEKGKSVINGNDCRWDISTHSNAYNGELMYNYVFLTYNDDKAYILTMVSTSKNFAKYKPLFERIAKTFDVKR